MSSHPDFLTVWMSPSVSSFWSANRVLLVCISGPRFVLRVILIGIWSWVSAHSCIGPQNSIRVLISCEANVRSMVVAEAPLLHVGSPLAVTSWRSVLLVTVSRWSARWSYTTPRPPYSTWCVLKSPSRRVSPCASCSAWVILGHSCILRPTILGL